MQENLHWQMFKDLHWQIFKDRNITRLQVLKFDEMQMTYTTYTP